MPNLLMVLIFLTVFGVIMIAVGLGARFVEELRRRRVSGVLDTVSEETGAPSVSVMIKRTNEEPLTRYLQRLNFAKKLEGEIQQAGLEWSLSQLLLYTLASALIGALIGSQLRLMVYTAPSMLILACLFATFPWLNIKQKRKKRMGEFERHFPEALDFLARAMRSGHAFSVSLEMLSEESPEPIRSEFKKVYNEQHLGESITTALRHLTERVPLLDVRFFVSAVLLQRETGGNLAEILTKLAHVIRERFRLKGQVRAASAHGRITALVLTFLPLVIVCLLMILSPEYLTGMARVRIGKILIAFAILGQGVGYLVMRKIINIKV